jgi:hypothetical protein
MTCDVVILACAISAGIHAALAPEHGASFVAATGLLAFVAAWLTLRPASRAAVAAAAGAFVSLLAAYALAVAMGEPLDGLALATKGIETVGLVAAITHSKGAPRWTRHGNDVRFRSA